MRGTGWGWAALGALVLAGGVAFAAAPSPQAWAGVWRHRFANGLVSGETYTSENVLEVVPVAPDAAYVRLRLEFYNGHQCAIAGVARATPAGLVYTTPTDAGVCRLTLAPARGGIRLYEDENGACRQETCGARGGYGYRSGDPAPEFTGASRRPIRYMPRLLASPEYKAALAAWRADARR